MLTIFCIIVALTAIGVVAMGIGAVLFPWEF